MYEKQVTFKNFILIKQKILLFYKISTISPFQTNIFFKFSQNFSFCVGGFGHVRNDSFLHLEKSMEVSYAWKIAPNPARVLIIFPFLPTLPYPNFSIFFSTLC